MKFTDLSLRSIPFAEGQRDYADDSFPGFSLRVGRRTKTFMVIVKSGERRSRARVGIYPDLTLSKAREKAKDILATARLAKEQPQRITFSAAFDIFDKTHCKRLRLGSAKELRRTLTKHFMPILGHRWLDEITPADLAPIFDGLVHVPAQARNSFVILRTFLNWTFKRGYIENLPTTRLDAPARLLSRDHTLTPEELRRIWLACPDTDYGDVVRLCILTGQRIGQWLNYRREFIEDDTITWPAELMKGKRRHTLPLTPMALRILTKDRFLCWRGAPNKNRLDQKAGVMGWTHHDLRRTWATISAEELDTSPHIIEAVLSHRSGTEVARTYNRATYQKPMRDALQAFEIYLQTLLSTTENTNGAELTGHDCD